MPNDLSPRPAPIPFDDALIEMERRIAVARVHTRPFPHIVVDDVLPQAVREGLDRYWPGFDRFNLSNHNHRGELRVVKAAIGTEGHELRLWSSVQRLALHANRAVRRRLERHFHDKYRPLLGSDWRRRLGPISYLDNDSMLAHYTGPLHMAPHIDNARVAINCFVYLDDPQMPTPEPRRGTTLYRSLGFSWPTNVPLPEPLQTRFLREDREIGWQENRLLAYVNGPWSFHGVSRHDLGESRRRLLMFGSLLDKETTERVLDPLFR
ncbi:hypothetical protein [Thalassobaculum sp.]|uniref:hypothetical protein n=1 Tax=Thalassobaculum sp. TaxID=2022740 RepID=UPI0032EC83E8